MEQSDKLGKVIIHPQKGSIQSRKPYLHGMRRRAVTIIWCGTIGIAHMALVIRRVEVDTIPAAWEHNRSTQAIGALCCRKLVRSGASPAVIETYIVDGEVGNIGSVVRGACHVSRNHAKSLRKGSDVLRIGITGSASL